MTKIPAFVFGAFLLCGSAFAQQRPLVTEDPETVGSGLVLIEGGLDYQRDVFYPVSGLEGNLLSVPVMGVSFGVGSIAELQIDSALYNRLSVTSRRLTAPRAHQVTFDGDNTADLGDIVIGTKVRLVAEGTGRPAFAVRFATRLPNASHESGLGTDTTDFFLSALIAKTVQSIRVVGNLGVGVLPKATGEDGQNDVITYGLSLARAVRQGVEIVAEGNGLWNPREAVTVGSEDRTTARFGGRITRGTVRVDGAAVIGISRRDTNFGFTAGFTWVFRGFTVP